MKITAKLILRRKPVSGDTVSFNFPQKDYVLTFERSPGSEYGVKLKRSIRDTAVELARVVSAIPTLRAIWPRIKSTRVWIYHT